jgi:hypothetical protein
MTPDGAIVDSNAKVKLCLVPVPQGRLVGDDIPCIEVERGLSTTTFPFTNVPPGLYGAYVTDPDYIDFKPLDNSGGFVYVPASGPAITAHGPVDGPVEYVDTLCAKNVRDGMVASGTINPQNGQPVEECSTPSGPPPPGGADGGGSQ